MKLHLTLVALLTLSGSLHCRAALAQWQSAITSGSATAYKNFTAVTSPVTVNVGTLTGDRTFEFLVNAAVGGTVSSALLGNADLAAGRQALKYEQYNTTGVIGVTAFGVDDYSTTVAAPSNLNTQVVFRFDGTKTDLYLNGAFKTTILAAGGGNVALALTGSQGLGAWLNGAAYVDSMQGSILGFASYDTALSPAEITTHYNAFAAPVPETGSAVLGGLAAAGAFLRRRRV